MVNRVGNKIHFSTDEQERFKVAPEVDTASALQTALGCNGVAGSLTEQALHAGGDPAWRENGSKRQILIQKATEFSTFAAAITHACEDNLDQELGGLTK